MNFEQLNGVSIPKAFAKFDAENPGVYRAFKEQAFRAIGAGAKKISSKAIINWLRWEVFIKTNDENFKINDAFTAHYARKFVEEFPLHGDKLEIRKLRTEAEPPFMLTDENGQIRFL